MSDKPPQWRILDEIMIAVYDHPEGFDVPFHENATIADLTWFQKRVAQRLPTFDVSIARDDERLHLVLTKSAVPVGSEVVGAVNGRSPADSSALAEDRTDW